MVNFTKPLSLCLCAVLCIANAYLPTFRWIDSDLSQLITWYTTLSLLYCVLNSGGLCGAAKISFFFGLFHFAISLLWLVQSISVLSLDTYAAYLLLALTYAFWGTMARRLERDLSIAALKWVAPAAVWTGVEFFRGEFQLSRFGWGALGYTQKNWVGFTIASIIGVYGISFVLVLWARLTLAAMSNCNEKNRQSMWVTVSVALLAVPALCFIPASPQPRLEMGTARLQQLKSYPLSRTFEPLRKTTDHLSPVDLLVWPEDAVLPSSGLWAMKRANTEASRTRVGMILGISTDEVGNTIFALNPKGQVEGSSKTSQVVGSPVKNTLYNLLREEFLPASVPIIQLPGPFKGSDGQLNRIAFGLGIGGGGSAQTIGGDRYQTFTREASRLGAQVIVFTSVDMLRFRAAETNTQILMASNSGPTFSVDGNGVIINQLPFGTTKTLDVPILPPPKELTFFVRYGWYFGPGCAVLIELLILVAAFLDVKKAGGGGDGKGEGDQRGRVVDELTKVAPEEGTASARRYSSCSQAEEKVEVASPPKEAISNSNTKSNLLNSEETIVDLSEVSKTR